MGKALRRRSRDGRAGGRALTRHALAAGGAIATLIISVLSARTLDAQRPTPDAPLRLDRGRFTAVCFPSDEKLATSLLARSVGSDSFPGLPRPSQHVLIAIAPDRRRFREWAGPGAPEWGAALAFPESRRIVMQGRDAGADAGDPVDVLRHELAHLALHEYLGDLAPRWFDEGYASYAARELVRNEVLATNFALALRGMPTFDELDDRFTEGATSAQAAYALAYRAVDDMAAIDPTHGLTLLFRHWKETGSLDRAMRAAFGTTLVAFEREWQTRTRRRYGGLALFSDLTLASVVVLLIISPLYLARRRRDRRRMAALVAADRAAEAAAERERAAVLDALLGPASQTPEHPTSENGGAEE
ncbi:MAG: peptidase MA family metallohydrolase [Gemmatimonadaceae bacterium]